jgi:hypothetical protein
LLLDGIQRRGGAQQKAARAHETHTESQEIQDYEEAVRIWKDALVDYGFAEESLKQAAQTSPLSPRARVLVQDAAQLAEKVAQDKARIVADKADAPVNLPSTERLIQQLKELHEELALAYEDYDNIKHTHQYTEIESALNAIQGYAEDILDLNRQDREAKQKQAFAKTRLAQLLREKSLRQWRWIKAGIAILVVLVLGTLGWYFAFGPGRRDAALRPTGLPTVSATTDVGGGAAATLTPAPSPTPGAMTATPEAAEATPAIQVLFYDEPRLCTLVRDGAMAYREPTVDSIGQSLGLGLGQSVDAVGATGDGQWLLLQLLSGERLWIDADVLQCQD